VDGSVGSRVALSWALEEAALRGWPLHVVHAWHYPSTIGPYVALAAAEVAEGARQVLEEAIRIARREASIEVSGDLVQGSAPKVLTDLAQGADLLVVGSRGRGGFTGLVLGSVGQHCAAHARCPTVIVHRSDSGRISEGLAETTLEESTASRSEKVERSTDDAVPPFGRGDERLDALRSQMDEASRVFIDRAVSFAGHWIPDQVAAVVQANPTRAAELGPDGLRALKAEMRDMVAKVPVAAGEMFRAVVRWPHTLTDISTLPAPWEGWHEVDQLVHRPPDELTQAVGDIVGESRSLLLRHGFARRGGEVGDTYLAGYSRHVDWSSELIEASNAYCRLYKSFYSAAQQWVHEVESTAKVNVRRLWEEA
jgi:nucleotide-binding universal stress UspA family protein